MKFNALVTYTLLLSNDDIESKSVDEPVDGVYALY